MLKRCVNLCMCKGCVYLIRVYILFSLVERHIQVSGCPKSAQSKTNFCVRHGGGRKCAMEGCAKVARGRTSHCAAHGGGIRCCVEGCNKAAVGR